MTLNTDVPERPELLVQITLHTDVPHLLDLNQITAQRHTPPLLVAQIAHGGHIPLRLDIPQPFLEHPLVLGLDVEQLEHLPLDRDVGQAARERHVSRIGEVVGGERDVARLGRVHDLDVAGLRLGGVGAHRVQGWLLGRVGAARHHMLRVLLDQLLQLGGEARILEAQRLYFFDVGVGDDGVLLDQLLVVDDSCVVDGDVSHLWFGFFNLEQRKKKEAGFIKRFHIGGNLKFLFIFSVYFLCQFIMSS